MSALRRRGLQFEIVANLFVVMLAGLAIVAVVMGSLAARTVEQAAVEQLRSEALHMQRAKLVGSLRLSDLAALARTLPESESLAHWTVRDASGRLVGPQQEERRSDPELEVLLARAQAERDMVRGGGVFSSDLILVMPLSGAESGLIVGRVPRAALLARLEPLLRSGAWVLASAATVFVAFGAYLLRWRIVAPLQALSRSTARLASGALDTRTEVRGFDELAELATGFNEMAASLERERRALVRTRDSLARSERLASVGQLAAGVAHEVGNPVAAILGYAELALRDPALSERSRDSAERICEEAMRVRMLVQELLDLASAARLELAPIDPADLGKRVVERMRAQPLLSAVELRLVAEPELPSVQSDAGRIEQILVNLIENAVHALAGRPGGTVELRVAPAGAFRPRRRRDDSPLGSVPEALSFSVLDDGPGIDPEHQSRVFDPFFTTKDPGKGTGLGLWNAHRLAELLGGRLELESAPGRTCFSLLLPLADSEPAPEDPDGSTACTDHR
jgi:signal transduction histidine kinase